MLFLQFQHQEHRDQKDSSIAKVLAPGPRSEAGHYSVHLESHCSEQRQADP